MTKSHRQSNASQRAAKREQLEIAWKQFNSLYPTDDACLEAIYAACERATSKCDFCGSANVIKDHDGRTITCNCCHETSWITAGTFFERMKLPRAWLGAIWIIDRVRDVNANQFHRLATIAYDTSWKLFRKISTVMHNEMGTEAASVSSAYFIDSFCKRSSQTPANEHPRAEQEHLHQGKQAGEREDSTQERPATKPNATFRQSNATVNQHNATVHQHNRSPHNRFGLDLMLASNAACQREQVNDGANKTFPDEESLPDLEGGGGAKREEFPGYDLTENQNEVCKALSFESISFDLLSERTGMSSPELSSVLTLLEMIGLVRSESGNRYLLSDPAIRNVHAGKSCMEPGHRNNLNASMHGSDQFPKSSSGTGSSGISNFDTVTFATDTYIANAKLGESASADQGMGADLGSISKIVRFICSNCHGISRKYLQLYLAWYWFCSDTTSWHAGSLLAVCAKSRPIHSEHILWYVSPPMVKVLASCFG